MRGKNAVQEYATAHHGPLPFGFTWAELEALKKDPNAPVRSEVKDKILERYGIFKALFDQEGVKSDVKKEIVNNKAVAFASSLPGHPAIKELQRDRAALRGVERSKGARADFAEAEQINKKQGDGLNISSMHKPVNVVTDIAHHLVEQLPKINGQVPASAEKYARELAKLPAKDVLNTKLATIEESFTRKVVQDSLEHTGDGPKVEPPPAIVAPGTSHERGRLKRMYNHRSDQVPSHLRHHHRDRGHHRSSEGSIQQASAPTPTV